MKHKLYTLQNINFHKRWITFTYFSPQIRTATNLLQHPNLRIALLTANTVTSLKQRHLTIIICGKIQPYLHNMPFKLRGPNLPETETTFFRVYTIYSVQKSTIGIWQTFCTRCIWIWNHTKYSDITMPSLWGTPYVHSRTIIKKYNREHTYIDSGKLTR